MYAVVSARYRKYKTLGRLSAAKVQCMHRITRHHGYRLRKCVKLEIEPVLSVTFTSTIFAS